MRFLADEGCDLSVVRTLRDAGHDVVTVQDIASGSSDEQVIRFALDENRTLITEDKDFGQLVFASASESPGVIYLRFPATARRAMVDSVLKLIRHEGGKLNERFVVVQPGRIRITRRIG